MDVADISLKIVFFLVILLNLFDLFYLDIYKKKTKDFFVGGIGASNIKVENKYLRWFLKIVMIAFIFFLLMYL